MELNIHGSMNSNITSSYKKQLQKIERKVGWSTKKNTNKGSKDGNKGQGSSLLLYVFSLWLPLFTRHLKLILSNLFHTCQPIFLLVQDNLLNFAGFI